MITLTPLCACMNHTCTSEPGSEWRAALSSSSATASTTGSTARLTTHTGGSPMICTRWKSRILETPPRTTSSSEESRRCRPGQEPVSTAMTWARRPSCALAWSMAEASASTRSSSCRLIISMMVACCSETRACIERVSVFTAECAAASARRRVWSATSASAVGTASITCASRVPRRSAGASATAASAGRPLASRATVSGSRWSTRCRSSWSRRCREPASSRSRAAVRAARDGTPMRRPGHRRDRPTATTGRCPS